MISIKMKYVAMQKMYSRIWKSIPNFTTAARYKTHLFMVFFLSWIGNLNFVPTLKCTYTFKKLHVESEFWNKQTYIIFPLNIFFYFVFKCFFKCSTDNSWKGEGNFFHPFSSLKFRCIFWENSSLYNIYTKTEREKIAEEEKKVVVFKKRKDKKNNI